MQTIRILTIFYFALECIHAQQQGGGDSDSCQTPENKAGQCVEIRNCSSMVEFLKTRPIPRETVVFLSKSQCGYLGSDPKVCCPLPEQTTGGNKIKPPPEPITSPLLPGTDVCGIQTDDRIMGGAETMLGEFPWMALLEYDQTNGKRGFHCGGSLISDQYILTAAHCIKGRQLPEGWKIISVRLGEHNTKTIEDCHDVGFGIKQCNDPPLNILVEESIAHEGFDKFNRNYYHDIGILRLAGKVVKTEYIAPICIPTSLEDLTNQFVGTNMYVAGWGTTENSSSSDIKLKLEVPVKNNADCSPVYQKLRVQIGDGQLCAGGEKGRDSCTGDSGGPLMTSTHRRGETNWYVVGIVSFGPPRGCGMAGWPGVYTRLADYVPWIVKNMRA